jgi:hypothetical protein
MSRLRRRTRAERYGYPRVAPRSTLFHGVCAVKPKDPSSGCEYGQRLGQLSMPGHERSLYATARLVDWNT